MLNKILLNTQFLEITFTSNIFIIYYNQVHFKLKGYQKNKQIIIMYLRLLLIQLLINAKQ